MRWAAVRYRSSSSGDVRSDDGDVVEPEVRAVARQQFGDVDVERQQIANRVAVLGAVQPMDDIAARVALALPRAIERAREPGREGRVLGFRGTRHALRRHRAHAQLAQHAFPRRRLRQQVVQARGLEIDRVVGRLRRAAVVAADAVLLDPGLMFRSVSRGGRCGRGAGDSGRRRCGLRRLRRWRCLRRGR